VSLETGRGSKRRWALVVAVVAITALFAAPLAFGLSRDPTTFDSALVGRPAPPFSLPALEGRGHLSLAGLRGHVVVVNFWASWCFECRVELDALARTWGRFRDRGVVLLGIPFQDPTSSARAFVREMGIDWPQLADPGSRVTLSYGVAGVPETFLIGADGRVLHRWGGPVSYRDLAERVDRSLEVATS
jgi:cytochrome c biogenesis protein CcmG, thiol:disulfide interchange protein DsbE